MDHHTIAIRILQTIRDRLADSSFLERHRFAPKDFTRRRKLPFSSVVLLVLQKSIKSLQLHLHEFFARVLCAAHRRSGRRRADSGGLDPGAREAAPQCLYRTQPGRGAGTLGGRARRARRPGRKMSFFIMVRSRQACCSSPRSSRRTAMMRLYASAAIW